MIAVIARLTAKEGHEQDLERTLRELAQQVLAEEPDCKLYQLCKGQAPRQVSTATQAQAAQTGQARSRVTSTRVAPSGAK